MYVLNTELLLLTISLIVWGCCIVIGINNNSPLLLLLFIFYFYYLFVVNTLFSLILLFISLLLWFFKLFNLNLPIILVFNPSFVCYKLANIFCVLYVFGKLSLVKFLLIDSLLLLLLLLSTTIEGFIKVTLCWCLYISCCIFY